MNKREFCHKLADMNAALYDIEKELREVKFKLVDEEDPDRRDWFNNALGRLLQGRDEMRESRAALEAEGYSDSE